MFLVLSAGIYAEARHQTRRPNVVLVLADDVGIGDVGYNGLFAGGGAVHTPVLDELAAQGTKLTRFYTNALCTPSRASLLTGRFASRTNMKNPDGETRSNKESCVSERSLSLPVFPLMPEQSKNHTRLQEDSGEELSMSSVCTPSPRFFGNIAPSNEISVVRPGRVFPGS